MAAITKTVEIKKTKSDIFPSVQIVSITSAISVVLSCSGANQVSYVCAFSGDLGVIQPNETKEIVTNSDSLTDDIEFTFYGPSTISIVYIDGLSSGTGGGTATAANQVVLINQGQGNIDNISVVEVVAVGIQNTDICLACSLKFYGSGGILDGIPIEDGYTVDFGTNQRNQINSISFEVPTAADFQGFQRVLISYVKM